MATRPCSVTSEAFNPANVISPETEAVSAVVGPMVGIVVGAGVGLDVGTTVGTAEGIGLGRLVDPRVGPDVGTRVGTAVGTAVGNTVGRAVDITEGDIVGEDTRLNHDTVPEVYEHASTSSSPSESISPVCTSCTPDISVEMLCEVKVGSGAPSFLYQETLPFEYL